MTSKIFKTAAILLLISVMISGCKKDEKTTFCKNLLKEGKATKDLLIGEWKFESYAFSEDGKKINVKETVLSFEKPYLVFKEGGDFYGELCGEFSGKFELNKKNNISFIYTYFSFHMCTSKEKEKDGKKIIDALEKALCYVIDNDKLHIHYSHDGDTNILILNKQ